MSCIRANSNSNFYSILHEHTVLLHSILLRHLLLSVYKSFNLIIFCLNSVIPMKQGASSPFLSSLLRTNMTPLKMNRQYGGARAAERKDDDERDKPVRPDAPRLELSEDEICTDHAARRAPIARCIIEAQRLELCGVAPPHHFDHNTVLIAARPVTFPRKVNDGGEGRAVDSSAPRRGPPHSLLDGVQGEYRFEGITSKEIKFLIKPTNTWGGDEESVGVVERDATRVVENHFLEPLLVRCAGL